MKKIWILIVMLIAMIIWSWSFAQENIKLWNETNLDKQVQVGMTIPDQTKLSYINIAFCNEGLETITKNGLLTVRPWQTKEICMVFANTSQEESADIIATFVDTELSNEGNMVCSLGVNTGKSLAAYISFDKEAYKFTLEPWQTIVRKAQLHVPQDMEVWTYNGCVGYQLDVQKKEGDTWIFFVVRRRVGLMEIMVAGDVYKFGWLDTIKYTYQNNKVMVLKWIAGIIWLALLRYIIVIIKWDKSKHKKNKEKK